jgi:hypothetical protein
MKKPLFISVAIALVIPVWAADLKPQLTKAAKELGTKANYSWTTTTKEGDGSPGRLGPLDGKADKDGIVFLSFAVGGVPVEVYLKGEKGAARGLEGWMTLDEIAQTSGTAAAVVKFLKSYKAPAAQSAELAGNLKDVTEMDGVLSGEMKEDAVKDVLLFAARRRDGQEAPKIADEKGTAKFWVKEGVLTKYEMKVQGKLTAGDRTTDIDRTLTTDLKDIGSTKLEVPEEAKQKML